MKDKEKQIEEMAKCYCGTKYSCNKNCVVQKTELCEVYEICELLYEQGYRKLPENSVVLSTQEYFNTVTKIRKEFEYEYKDKVVLSREEYENLKNQIKSLRTELAKAVCLMYTEEEFEYKVDQKIKEELDRVEKEASKETAEKILNEVYFYAGNKETINLMTRIKEIATREGVEIKE